MAIFIPGMCCALSGRSIESIDDAVLFPPFILNEADPLFVFSDAVIHRDVFHTHHLANAAQTRLNEAFKGAALSNRVCKVCGQPTVDPIDYIGFGHLIEDQTHALYRYNYAHFHKSCLARWSETHGLITILESFCRSGFWQGNALERLLNDLRSLSV